MRIKILLMTVLALGLLITTAYSADIAGTWKGTTEMMGQSRDVSFTFVLDAKDKTVFTGTTPGRQGAEDPISEGKIEGDNVSFTVKNAMGMVIKYKGTVKDDEMTLTREFDFSGVDFSKMGGGPGGGGMGGPPPGGGGGGMGGPPPGGGGGPGGGMGTPPPIVVKMVQ